MRLLITLLAVAGVLGMAQFRAASADQSTNSELRASVFMQAMAEGIGDLSFASPEWVDAAQAAFTSSAKRHAAGLNGVKFTFCVVAHNPPAYLRVGGKVSWHARIDGTNVTAAVGELPGSECDWKLEGDHSILSNLTHIQHNRKDPKIVQEAQARWRKLSRWVEKGKVPDHVVLKVVLRDVHDTLAPRTMPRYVFMTPEWVTTARYIVTTRSEMEQFKDGLKDATFVFAEEFTHTPRYAFPDGSHGGFYVHLNHGQITVGAAPLPEGLGADVFTKGQYTPVVPVGRTFNPGMTKADIAEKDAYGSEAFKPGSGEEPIIKAFQNLTGKPWPAALGGAMSVLHDELSKRTSGELPSDYDHTLRPAWSKPQGFDRDKDYDASWVLYDKFDIYGNPR